MQFNLEPLIVIALVSLALVGTLFRHHRDKQHLTNLRERATQAFLDYVVHSNNERFAFKGTSAIVQRREEVGGLRGIFEREADFSVRIYAFNEHGEAFLFKWFSKSQKPFFKHIPKAEKQKSGTT